MDPVTLIVTALATGLSSGVGEMAKAAVNDMYESLTALLKKKTEQDDDAKTALNAVEKNPESKARQDVLKEELTKLGIEKDIELIQLAQSILKKLDQKGAQAGKYNIAIHKAQGVVIGDRNDVKQTFIDSSGEKQDL